MTSLLLLNLYRTLKADPLQYYLCSREAFDLICQDFGEDQMLLAIACAKSNRLEESHVLAALEGGFNGYYWNVKRNQRRA